MKSEKVTINLSAVELAQIDFLVEKGLYASRSDFIRLATRKQTEDHKKEIEQFVDDSSHDLEFDEENLNAWFFWGLGTSSITQQDIEVLVRTGKKIDIRMIGVLIIKKDVSPEQFRQVLKRVKVYGKVNAEPEIKAIIEEFNEKG